MIDLQKFCHDFARKINTPWSAGAFSYATDGAICIRVPRRDDITRDDGPGPAAAALFATCEKDEGALEALPDIAVPVRPAHMPCEDCGGSGKLACFHCGQDMECDSCDGKGVVEPPTIRIEIAKDRWIGAPYYDMLRRLPELRIDLAGTLSPHQVSGRPPGHIHYFVFDGGDGLLMGILPSTDPTLNIPLSARATEET